MRCTAANQVGGCQAPTRAQREQQPSQPQPNHGNALVPTPRTSAAMDRSDNAKQISRADRQLSMHPRLRLRGGRSGSCFHFAPVGNGGGGQAKIELMYNTVTVSSSVRDASSGPTPLHPKVQEIDFVSKQKKKNQPRRNFSPSRPPRFAFWCFQSGSSEHPHTRRAVQACMHSKWMHDRCSMTVSSSPILCRSACLVR